MNFVDGDDDVDAFFLENPPYERWAKKIHKIMLHLPNKRMQKQKKKYILTHTNT